MKMPHAFLGALTVMTALGAGCSSGTTADGDTPGGTTTPRLAGSGGEGTPANVTPRGLELEVREGNPRDDGQRPPAADAQPLPDDATARLLARIPAIDAQATDRVGFALREGSKPPPLTGATLTGTFPPPVAPPGGAPAVDPGPFEVLRYQPEGDVPIAPRISVTFSSPMVAVTSHDELAKDAVPAKITPPIDGTWRWVGTKTLFFEPGGRAPMATDYTVEVPAGVKDATGRALDKGVSWRFSTPPPKLLSSSPGGTGVALDPTLVLVFDQRVDPAAIRASLRVMAGDRPVELRDLTAKELEARPEASNADLEGRWVAFKPAAALPKDTPVQVTLGPGTPSAEGPRKTTEPQTFSFRTYGPFEVVEHKCGWRDCSPGQPWRIRMSNTIGEDFDPAMVEVSPKVDGLVVDVGGSNLSLRGLTRGRTTYTVRLSREMADIYGQKLGPSEPMTFEVGPAPKMLGAPDAGLIVLDPTAKKRRFGVYAINYDELDVALYRVTPADWGAYQAFLRTRHRDDGPKAPPGERVFSERVATQAPPEALTEVAIDLAPALVEGYGQIIAVIKPVGAENERTERSQTVISWLQATDLGIDAFVDRSRLHGWATDLKTGQAVAGAQVTLHPQQQTVTTGADGLARFDLPATSASRQLLIARRGADVAFIPDNIHSWSDEGRWTSSSDQAGVRWLVFDDRQMYRPDEEVSIKGFMRVIEPGAKGDVTALPAGSVTQVRWKVVDSRNNDLASGAAKVDRFGGFDLAFKLPKTPNLGYARVEFTAAVPAGIVGGSTSHGFQIQEFRRPEFEVSARASEGPHLVGGTATMTVNASYFAGGPLPNAEASWVVTTRPASFTPPNQSGFTFGEWIPWWEHRGFDGGDSVKTFEGATDASGEHTVALDFKSVDPPRAMAVTGEATVMDVNRQAWSASANLLVHPASHYVGLRTPRSFVSGGEPITIEAIVANLDGQRLSGSKIAVEMVRLSYRRDRKLGWTQVEVEPQTCELTSAADPVDCKLTPKLGGTHRVRATITDDRGRQNRTTLTVWVAGGKQPQSARLELESVQLIPAKQDYQPGETAELLVQAPFSPADGVMRVIRGDLVEITHFRMDGPSHALKIPVEEWMIPGFTVNVTLNGSAERVDGDGEPAPDLPRRPAFAAGSITFRVPPTLRTLSVAVEPAAAKTEPAAETSVAVTLRDASGAPVADASVALVVVDEAVLALSGYTMPNPLDVFYTLRGDGTRAHLLRQHIVLASLDDLLARAERAGRDAEREEASMEGAAMPSAAPRMAMKAAAVDEAPGGGGGGDAPIAVRRDFNPLASFAPSAVTDASGRAVVSFKLPDNLTRYRVMAIAVHGDNAFGSAESAITARLPLMVRMSPPRFLNFGDRFELPVVLQNQTDGPLDVAVAVRATNAKLTAGAGRTVRVPANDRVEVRFPAEADMAGTARFQAAATAGAWADAAEVALPVWTPATTEAFATYGEIDDGGAVQPVQTPGEVVTQFGGLDVTTSSTQLQALTDAVLYLTSYPFECSEQVASRVLSIAALKDVLTAFEAEGLPEPEAMVASVARDLELLRGMQNGDGGWGFWRRGQESWPFLTIHVAHAMSRAKDKGFSVHGQMLAQATRYLEQIERHIPSVYHDSVKRAIRAYALYVLDRLGKSDPAKARAIVGEGGGIDKLGLEVVGWLYPVLSGKPGYEQEIAAIRKHVNNSVRETAGLAHFTTSYSDGAHVILHSNRRVDGLLLEGLIKDEPKSDLIPKIVRGLLGHRKAGRWGNTQENAWVLVALDRYFNTYEKVEPNFVARVWLGDAFAGEHTFKGRTTERHHVAIPMAWLAKTDGPQDLTLTKTGAGRLYYRLGMRYAPASLKLDPADHGFTVERVYEAVDDPADVRREADGSWVIKAGALVKVTLTMFTPDRRYHVALVDPMPAGLEALNPAIKGTANVAQQTQQASGRGGRGGWWWWGPWYEHQNLRDERAEAFTSLLWQGVHTYSYVARATTLGRFVVPPPKAEEMYHPETFGRGGTDVVVVK